MSRPVTHRSGDVEYNGKSLFTISGGATSANSTQRLARWVAPCDGTVIQLDLNITTQITNAAARLTLGLISDTDSHLDDFVLTNLAVGLRELSSNVLMVSKAIVKGNVYVVEFVNADTTGVLDFTVVIEPT